MSEQIFHNAVLRNIESLKIVQFLALSGFKKILGHCQKSSFAKGSKIYFFHSPDDIVLRNQWNDYHKMMKYEKSWNDVS